MITVTDLSKEIIKDDEFPLTLDNVILKLETPAIALNLVDWEKGGLRIGISVEGLGHGYFNEVPYTDKAVALAQYAHVMEKVMAGQYSLEIHENSVLKLNLAD